MRMRRDGLVLTLRSADDAMDQHNREFPQIENVDIGMNIDVESHPVGSTTPKKMDVQSSKCLFCLCHAVYFLFVLIFSFEIIYR